MTLALCLFLLSSCGIFRNVEKDKHREQIEVKVTEDRTTNDSETTTDKTVVTTVEETETPVTIPPKKVSTGGKTIEEIGKGVEVTDSTGLLTIKLSLDSLGQVLAEATTKEEEITIPTKKTTREERDVTTVKERDDIYRREESIESDTLNKEVTKEGKNAFWFIIAGLGVVGIVAYLIYRIIKRRIL